jgi:ribosomal protein L37AE/L43A
MVDKLICPKCESTRMNTYRMPTGPIWCSDCDTEVVEKKEELKLIVKDGEYYDVSKD